MNEIEIELVCWKEEKRNPLKTQLRKTCFGFLRKQQSTRRIVV